MEQTANTVTQDIGLYLDLVYSVIQAVLNAQELDPTLVLLVLRLDKWQFQELASHALLPLLTQTLPLRHAKAVTQVAPPAQDIAPTNAQAALQLEK